MIHRRETYARILRDSLREGLHTGDFSQVSGLEIEAGGSDQEVLPFLRLLKVLRLQLHLLQRAIELRQAQESSVRLIVRRQLRIKVLAANAIDLQAARAVVGRDNE